MSSGHDLPPAPPSGQPNPFGGSNPYTSAAAGTTQPQSSSSMKAVWIILGVAFMGMLTCGGVFVALLIPAMNAVEQASKPRQRANNIKQIGLGMHNYHAAFNQLPFTVCENSSGTPTIGWRLAISPFVDGQPQWAAVSFDEPWDGPTNQAIGKLSPLAFQAIDGAPGITNVFVIVGPVTMFSATPLTKLAFRDVLDGLAQTVMAIELPNRETRWSSTKNITPDEAFTAIEVLPSGQVAHLLMGDGAVHAITSDFDRTTFDALVTRAGSETIDMSF